MDLWAKLLGFEPPEVTVLEGEYWIDVPVSPKLDRALSKRAAKEGWDLSGLVEFHALLLARKASLSSVTEDALDVDVCGVTALHICGADAAATLARMRAGKSAVVATRARAHQTDAGSWKVEVSIL